MADPPVIGVTVEAWVAARAKGDPPTLSAVLIEMLRLGAIDDIRDEDTRALVKVECAALGLPLADT